MISDFRKLCQLLDHATRRKIPTSLFFSILIAIFEMFGLAMIMPLLVIVAEPQNMEKYEWLSSAIAPLSLTSREDILLFFGIVMACMFLLKNILTIYVNWWQTKFLAKGESTLSIKLVRYYNRLSYLDITSKNSSELIRTATINVQMTISSFLLPILSLVTELLIVTGVAVVIFLANAKLALGLILFFIFAVVMFYVPLRGYMNKLGEGLLDGNFRILKSLKEGIGAVKEIRTLNREGYFLDDYATHRIALGEVRAQHVFLTSIGRPYLELMMLLGIGVAAVTMLSGIDVAEVVGVIGLVGAASLRAMPSVNRILTLLQSVRVALPSVRKIISEFEMQKDVEHSLLKDEGEEQAVCSYEKSGKSIKVSNLHFSYPDRDGPALIGFNMEIPFGCSVGIVGASGSGKSTLVNILLGLLAPTKGFVSSDGADIRSGLFEWRQRVGYVPQNIYLTDDTIRANVAFALPMDQINEKRLKEALRLAHFDDVLAELPQGLDTIVGDEGVRLSGGQRQRIGIARALYHNPDVLIFDEATSALDNVTESKISRMIHELTGNKTIIIIAHRLSTIQNCDNIIMLKDGVKLSEGSFNELEATCPDFKKLLNVNEL